MDYQREYSKLNPNYHYSDAPRKLKDITETFNAAPKSIIDLGCGIGRLSSFLYSHYQPEFMEAVDISREAILKAREHESKDIEWVVGDTMKYKPNRKFEAGIIADLLEHLEQDKLFLAKVSDYADKIVIRVPLENTLVNRLIKKLRLGDEFLRSEKRFGHIHHYSLPQLENLFNDAGLATEKCKLFPLAKRSLFRFELLRWTGLAMWLFSPRASAEIIGALAVFVLKRPSANC